MLPLHVATSILLYMNLHKETNLWTIFTPTQCLQKPPNRCFPTRGYRMSRLLIKPSTSLAVLVRKGVRSTLPLECSLAGNFAAASKLIDATQPVVSAWGSSWFPCEALSQRCETDRCGGPGTQWGRLHLEQQQTRRNGPLNWLYLWPDFLALSSQIAIINFFD